MNEMTGGCGVLASARFGPVECSQEEIGFQVRLRALKCGTCGKMYVLTRIMQDCQGF